MNNVKPLENISSARFIAETKELFHHPTRKTVDS